MRPRPGGLQRRPFGAEHTGMDATAALTAIEALLAALPVADREALLDAVEGYGDLRADEALTA